MTGSEEAEEEKNKRRTEEGIKVGNENVKQKEGKIKLRIMRNKH